MSTTICVVGIDPGFQGGIACLTLDGAVVDVWPMPVLQGRRKTINGRLLAEWLDKTFRVGPIRLVVVEEPGQRPQFGADADADARGQSRGFRNSGVQFRELGRIEGVLDALALPVRLIQARRWQESILGALPERLRKHDERRKERKRQSIAWATRRYPSACLVPGKCRKPQDGLADALGIAEFGRRDLVGGGMAEGREETA